MGLEDWSMSTTTRAAAPCGRRPMLPAKHRDFNFSSLKRSELVSSKYARVSKIRCELCWN